MARASVDQPSSERRSFIGDAKFGLFAKWAASHLRHQHSILLRLWRGTVGIIRITVMLRWMRIRPFDLDKAFRADRLVAPPRLIQIRRIEEKANGTFGGILVQEYLHALAIDIGIFRKLDLLGRHLSL